MEIKLYKIKYKDIINELSLVINSNQVTALISKDDIVSNNVVKLIMGLEQLNDGTIKIGTKAINNKTKLNVLNLAKSNISYLYEDYNKMLFNINVFEDIKYLNSRVNSTKLKELLSLFDLDETILSKNYQEISSSERKKILIISIILKNSKIIILNNPTSNLDNKSVQTLIKILRKIKRDNKMIIILSKDTDFLLQVTDRIVLLDNKTVIADGNKFEILSNETILKTVKIDSPKVINFENRVYELKKIKLGYRDNISDLIKDIYRHVK